MTINRREAYLPYNAYNNKKGRRMYLIQENGAELQRRGVKV